MVANQPAKSGQDVAPDFRDRYNVVFDAWQSGDITYADAVSKLDDLKKEAVLHGHLANQAGAELIMGIMQGYRANLNESIKHFENARDLFSKVNNRERVATCTLNIGESYRLKGNFTQARRFFHAAYEAASQLQDEKMQVSALTNEGQMLISMGRYEQARAALEDAHRLSKEKWSDEPRIEASRIDNLCEIHHALAVIYLELGHALTAWEHAKKSLLIAQDIKHAYRVGFANRAIAEVLTRLGTPPDAGFSSDPDDYYQAASEAFRELKADGELARTMYAQGKSLAKRGKRMPSARKLQQAMVIFTRLGMVDDAAKAAEAQLEVL
jgi:tetratricopeptide (TPR) repeat protein